MRLHTAIVIVAPRLIVVGAELAPKLAAARARLEPGLKLWVYGGGSADFEPLDAALEHLSGEAPSDGGFTAPTLDATALYI